MLGSRVRVDLRCVRRRVSHLYLLCGNFVATVRRGRAPFRTCVISGRGPPLGVFPAIRLWNS